MLVAPRRTAAVAVIAVLGLVPAALLPAAASGTTTVSSSRTTAAAAAAWTAEQFEAEVLRLTNRARSRSQNCGREGVKPRAAALRANGKLALAAGRHARDMAVHSYFSHTSRNGRDPGDRITAAGYRWSAWGENIAAGFGSPRAVVAGWLESDGHCANLMSRRFTHLGVGYARDGDSEYGTYWVQDFGRR